jgi:hypothetical protein
MKALEPMVEGIPNRWEEFSSERAGNDFSLQQNQKDFEIRLQNDRLA